MVKKYKEKSEASCLTAEEVEVFFHGMKSPDASNRLSEALLMPYDKKFEIPRKDIFLG